MFTSEFNERSRSNPLCDFRLGTVATSDHETPLTQNRLIRVAEGVVRGLKEQLQRVSAGHQAGHEALQTIHRNEFLRCQIDARSRVRLVEPKSLMPGRLGTKRPELENLAVLGKGLDEECSKQEAVDLRVELS